MSDQFEQSKDRSSSSSSVFDRRLTVEEDRDMSSDKWRADSRRIRRWGTDARVEWALSRWLDWSFWNEGMEGSSKRKARSFTSLMFRIEDRRNECRSVSNWREWSGTDELVDGLPVVRRSLRLPSPRRRLQPSSSSSSSFSSLVDLVDPSSCTTESTISDFDHRTDESCRFYSLHGPSRPKSPSLLSLSLRRSHLHSFAVLPGRISPLKDYRRPIHGRSHDECLRRSPRSSRGFG